MRFCCASCAMLTMNGCFGDWEGSRSRFEDAGILDTMEELLADETPQQSWDTLSSHAWTLGNGE